MFNHNNLAGRWNDDVGRNALNKNQLPTLPFVSEIDDISINPLQFVSQKINSVTCSDTATVGIPIIIMTRPKGTKLPMVQSPQEFIIILYY